MCKQYLIPNPKVRAWFYLMILVSGPAHASSAPAQSQTVLREVVVSADRDADRGGVESLPATEGAKIYSGKKTSVIRLKDAPPVVNNNFRQVLQKTPGLLVSEESTPLISIGYRGLNPGRAQFSQVLKDGIPIHADMFGYPEAYYVPATQTVDRVEFFRGGASLLYGPQPGGALNFVTVDPDPDTDFSASTENSWGSHDLFSDHTAVSGTRGTLGYYGYYHHRESQGFRDFNSQSEVDYSGFKLVWDRGLDGRWTAGLDLYEEAHGEPGGLTRAAFDTDLSVTTRMMDRFELNRTGGWIAYERDLDEATRIEAKIYGVDYERLSWRQRGGGFGTQPTGAAASTNDIENQRFYTGGAEARIRRDYSGLGSEDEHTFTAGLLYHHTTSPRTDRRGTEADAEDGTVRKDSDRTVDDVSVFAENLFRFGAWSVTPSVRLENIWQGATENVNLDKTTVPLADESVYDFVALAGVGAEYEIRPALTAYSNFSQGYRPMIFTQAVPTGTNQVVNSDLKEGRSWQTDLGLRGSPFPSVSMDVSYFHMEFDDQIGNATIGGVSTVQNVGDARHRGVELAADWELWNDAGTSFKVFYNAMFLDAEFTGGPNTGKTPQYAPDFIQKGGVEAGWREAARVRLAGTFLDDHFADDTNSAAFTVPSYGVWDLTFDWTIDPEGRWTAFAGINNLFDERYFARVTGGGIDPADGRNAYGGFKYKWG